MGSHFISLAKLLFRKIARMLAIERFITYDTIMHSENKLRKDIVILVTGARGFVGQSLVPLLIEHGHSVRCLMQSEFEY